MTAKAAASGGSIIKVAVTASAAAAIEWYDFFIYGTAAALVFPTLFFPPDLPPFVAQIAAFSTFAVGFIARPIGGILFGHFGDRGGRKRALSVALLLMGLATTCIGLLPELCDRSAWLAPLALVVLRFAQGLAVGGQWGGAALMAIESAPPGSRGFYGSFVQIGVPLGLLLPTSSSFWSASDASEQGFLALGLADSVPAERRARCSSASMFISIWRIRASSRTPKRRQGRCGDKANRLAAGQSVARAFAERAAGGRRVRREQYLLLYGDHLHRRLWRFDSWDSPGDRCWPP